MESLPKACPWLPEWKESRSSDSFKLLGNSTLNEVKKCLHFQKKRYVGLGREGWKKAALPDSERPPQGGGISWPPASLSLMALQVLPFTKARAHRGHSEAPATLPTSGRASAPTGAVKNVSSGVRQAQ